MAKERFVVFSSLEAFKAGSDKYDNDSIVFVKDSAEPGIYTHTYGWVTLPSNGVANQMLSFIEGKAKWIDKDYYTKAEIEQKIDEIDVTEQLAEYAKTSEVEQMISEAKEEVEGKIPTDFYSKAEVDSAISNVKSEIIGGAGEDYDTLKELEAWITEHQDLYEALVSANATKEYVESKVTELKSEIESTFEDYVGNEDLEETLQDYYTKAEVDAMWAWGEY